MDPEAPSRAAMQGLLLPPPVPLWPATPAWYVLGVLMLLVLLWLAWRAWWVWRRDAYRRAALRALDRACAPLEIAVILKRTALGAWPRGRVASLTGAAWADWLRASAPRAGLSESMARLLAELAYLPAIPSGARQAARSWIRWHDPRA